MLKKILSIALIAMLLCFAAIPAVSAAGDVSFTLECAKPDYTFTVYRVANFEQTDSTPYGTKYTSLVSDVSSAIMNGDTTKSTESSALLSALDSSQLSGAATVGTYNSSTDGASKLFSNLDKGIYYVKATNYPAGVKSVTNSVFALPYYNETTKAWVNTIDNIDVGAKTTEDTVSLVKEITNSTHNNKNYTDGSLGDTVNFKITSDTAGSDEMTLNSYVFTDTMSRGLTYTENSLGVELQTESGENVKTLTNTEYTVKTTGGNGSDTVITVTLTPATVLASGSEFYDADKVVITYSATINKYAVTGKAGNPNSADKIEYTNKNNVKSITNGNEVYVYTYAVSVNKKDQSNAALAGAKFSLYDSTGTTVIGTGTSTSAGLVNFKKTNGDDVKLAPGSYIIRETEAPAGYNRYVEPITVTVNPTYETVYNSTTNTWVKTTADNGVYSAGDVINSKTVLPATGGMGDMWLYIASALVLVAAAGAFAIHRRKARASK